MRLLPLAVLLAWAAAGADYPVSAGYMNDLTGTIPDAVQQALELRLRAYERATSNEVAVAVVPSLQGQSVEEYARGLFKAWKLGKAEKSNGVLFLWAPNERQLRIQVGYGLESVLTDSACAAILSRATGLFKEGSSSEAVRRVVDGIIERLGETAPSDTADEPRRGTRGGGFTDQLIVGGIALVVLVAGIMFYHTRRAHQLQEEVPASLSRAAQELQQADARYKQAGADLDTLREESPPEVWQPLPGALAAVPEQLQALSRKLSLIQGQRREEYREWRASHRELRQWNRSFDEQSSVLARISGTLTQFREARDISLARIPAIADRLSLAAERLSTVANEQVQKLMDAARENFARVGVLRQNPPVNWLLAGDLLEDAEGCLRCIDTLLDPSSDLRQKRGAILQTRAARLWAASGVQSPAWDEMAALALLWERPGARSSDSGAFVDTSSASGGFSGGDSGGGFGGGDTGGGGASASY